MSVTGHGLPILLTLFVWWFSTGAILYLDGLPRRTFRWTMAGATLVLGAALLGLALSKDVASPWAAAVAFTCGVLAWGWQEVAFLLGGVTGPRTRACPPGCTGWRRFGHAVAALLYHELAVLAGAVAVLAVTWGGENQIGAWTYLLLWAMRQSAKLNLFLGVPNSSEELLPGHLAFLGSYFGRRPMNLLFPVSITAATVALALLAQAALAPGADGFAAAAATYLATLLALAILEHWLLVLPIPATALWSWGLRSRRAAGPPAGPPALPAEPGRAAERAGLEAAFAAGAAPVAR